MSLFLPSNIFCLFVGGGLFILVLFLNTEVLLDISSLKRDVLTCTHCYLHKYCTFTLVAHLYLLSWVEATVTSDLRNTPVRFTTTIIVLVPTTASVIFWRNYFLLSLSLTVLSSIFMYCLFFWRDQLLVFQCDRDCTFFIYPYHGMYFGCTIGSSSLDLNLRTSILINEQNLFGILVAEFFLNCHFHIPTSFTLIYLLTLFLHFTQITHRHFCLPSSCFFFSGSQELTMYFQSGHPGQFYNFLHEVPHFQNPACLPVFAFISSKPFLSGISMERFGYM